MIMRPMISGDGSGLSFPVAVELTVEENPGKKPQAGKLPRPGIESGPAK